MQRLAHRLDALAHRRQLGLPSRAAASGSVEHGGDDLAAVDRRARVVAAHRELQLAEHVVRLGRVGADDAQRAAALAVQAHALRERVGDEEGERPAGPVACRGERAQRVRVLDDAVAEALVGEVEVGQQLAARRGSGSSASHCARRQVDAGRVVAARVQQDDALRRHARAAPRTSRRSRGRRSRAS